MDDEMLDVGEESFDEPISESYDEPEIFEESEIIDEIEIIEEPELVEDTEITEELEIIEDTEITEESEITEDPEIIEDTEIPEEPEITDDTEITEEPEIIEDTEIIEDPEIIEDTEIIEESEIIEDTEITEEPEIIEDTEITEEPEIIEDTEIPEESEIAAPTESIADNVTYNNLSDYLSAHNYGKDDYDTYSQDPEWRRLMQIEYPETELPPLTQETIDDILSPYEGKTYDSIAEYYGDHNFGQGDYEIYSQDREWRRLMQQEHPDVELPPLSQEKIDSVLAEYEGKSYDSIAEYINDHQFAPSDYEIYSQDPEWRRLMEIEYPETKLPPLNSSEALEDSRVFNEFETSMMDKNPIYKDYYESGLFYDQGLNEYGFSGTCGPTSQANAVNHLLSTNEFTENKILQIAVDNNLCEMSGAPEDCGGTTTDNFLKLYEKVNEQTGNKLDVQLYEYDNALDINEMANRLDNGSVLNVAVDSAVLWGQADNYGIGYRADSYSDHWITITGAERDAAGKVVGFNIIDSGGGESYVDADVCDRMCFGDDNHRVIDPTMIVVSKK